MKTIPIQTGLKLADGFIELLRSELNLLTSWIDFTFPAVQIGKNQLTGKTYPEVYLFSGFESQIIIPDFNIKSFCFFEKLQTLINEQINTYSLNLIFWLDLHEINKGIDYLVSEVVEILDKYSCYDISVNYDDVFKKYGMDYVNNQWFTYPYSKFAISFKSKQVETC